MSQTSTITAPSVEANDKLFALYKTFANRPNCTRDEFYLFLTTNSLEREEFLSQYTTSDYTYVDNIVIHQVK